MKKKSKIFLSVILIVLIVTVIGIYSGTKIVKSNLEKARSLKISNINLLEIEDGSYLGNYKLFPVTADVEVVVKDHRIVDIELIKHTNGKGAPAEIITDEVIKDQTLEVDIITGATFSSKVILKAIENALNNARK